MPSISKQKLDEMLAEANAAGYYRGAERAQEKLKDDVKIKFAQEKTNLVHAAAELAQANAKLTYALSRLMEHSK